MNSGNNVYIRIAMNLKKYWNDLDPAIRIVSIAAVSLMIYGQAAKLIGIYFFWESFYLGLILVFCSLGCVLLVDGLVKIKVFDKFYREGWRTALYLFFGGLFFIIEFFITISDSLAEAKNHLKVNEGVNKLVGKVYGFGWITTGSVSTYGSGSQRGEHAVLNLIVKGSSSFTEITVEVNKTNDEPWEFRIIEIH